LYLNQKVSIMKKLLLFLLICANIFCLFSCGGGSSKVSSEEKAKNDSIQKAKEDSIKSEFLNQIAKDSVRFKELEQKFKHEIDEFDSTSNYYEHKNRSNNYLSSGLYTLVWEHTGSIYMYSYYYGSDWLFHTQVEVKINDKTYKTEKVETYDDLYHTNVFGGSISEKISFTGGKDNGVLEAIAKSSKDDVILIRFTGDKYYKDIKVSEMQISALRESYELSEILKRRNEYLDKYSETE